MRLIPFAAALAGSLFVASSASAFCGFYVAGADSKLFADASQVVLMREGTRTVVSMQNDYKGPAEKFAMVVPVPVVLQKEQVKTLPRDVFDKIDKLGAPRLVEYWEQDPCGSGDALAEGIGLGNIGTIGFGAGTGSGRGADLGVKVEAKFAVGEYEIVILSAKDSSGLETWLKEEKYAIPEGAEPFFRPYVQNGSKFFVARVDPAKVKFEDSRATLSPLRFHYDANEFSLPIKLGLINSSGMQDLIVNVLARGQRYEVANLPNVTIPTNLDVSEAARGKFAEFYAALFDQTLEKNPKAVVTEYSWDAGTCDPCPGPTLDGNDVMTLGADVIANGTSGLVSQPGGGSGIGLPRQGVTPTLRQGPMQVNGRLPPEIVQRVVRQSFGRFRLCYENGLKNNPKLQGRINTKLVIDGKGAVSAVQDGGSDLPDQATIACVQKAFRALSFPQPEGGVVTVVYALILNPPDGNAPPPPPRVVGFGGTGNFVLTRLHLRYGKDGLGEDLVFKAAGPIQGGRELRTEGVLEQGAQAGLRNNFQGRYAIRHPWKGPIECKEPKRNRWGGPPKSEAGTESTPATQAAQKTAFAPRGQTPLATFLATDVAPMVAPAPSTTSPEAGADAGAAQPDSRRGCAGCGISTSGDRWAPLLGIGLAMAALLRRKR